MADDLLEEHVVVSLLKQARLQRTVGEAPEDTDLDDLGLDAEELPPGDGDPDVHGLVAVGESDADAYAVVVDEDDEDAAAQILLLRGGALRDAPYQPYDLPSALTALTGSGLPVDHRRALERFAERAPEPYAVTVGAAEATIEGPGGTVTVEFDEHGRIGEVRGEIEGVDQAFDGVEEVDIIGLGQLELPDGRVVAGDPFMAVTPEVAEPLPGAVPKGRHDVAVLLADDPAGGHRVRSAFLVVAEGEVVEWEPVAAIPVDSGIACFGTPEAVKRLVEGGDEALAPVEQALAASAVDTWEHAVLDGLVAFSTGFGDGQFEVAWGYDAEESLVCVAIDCLPDWQLEGHSKPDADPPTGTPGRGLQRGFLAAAGLGAEWAAANSILLPPDANRALTEVDRRVARALLAGHDIQYEATPEYDPGSSIPARVRVKVDGGPASFSATVELGPTS